MKVFQLILSLSTIFVADLAFAGAATPPMELPILSGGLIAIITIGLAASIYVARNKHKE